MLFRLATSGRPCYTNQSYPYQGIGGSWWGLCSWLPGKPSLECGDSLSFIFAEVKLRLMGIIVHEKLMSIQEDTRLVP